jgi:hypothetical protein
LPIRFHKTRFGSEAMALDWFEHAGILIVAFLVVFFMLCSSAVARRSYETSAGEFESGDRRRQAT